MNAAERLNLAAAAHLAPVFGWDVGGAHVKVSMTDASGAVLLDVAQWACPLWQGLDHLAHAIERVFARWPAAQRDDARHAVTMTGEMVDLFADREEGVRAIVGALLQRLGPALRFYAGDAGWLDPNACVRAWRSVASANWHASAHWVATRVPNALFVDIGSTTTDIVAIVDGRVATRAASDAERLASGELVYHGVVRTPLCALAQRMEFGGARVNVMNEWFATTADVYRLTRELAPHYDQHPSADHGPKTLDASRARIARMIGRDARDASAQAWDAFALCWRERQVRAIGENLARVMAAHRELDDAPIVGAGCGRFLAAGLAANAPASKGARRYIDFGALAGACSDKHADETADWAATCAPSVAVARLAAAQCWQ